MTTLRLSSPATKTARLFAALLLCFCCALPLPQARANNWIISPTGTTSLPATANAIQASDTISLFMDATTGGPNALITMNGNNSRSFTIQSGDGAWHNLTNTKPISTTSRAMTLIAGSATISLVNINIANNATSGNGGAITLNNSTAGAATTDLTAFTGTAAFTANGGAVAGLLGGVIQDNAGSLLFSGSFVFASNIGDRGGAINMAAGTGNLTLRGDILFTSNTAMTSNGGAINDQCNTTGTIFVMDYTRFTANISGSQGGAIADVAGNGNYIYISGTTLFDGNKAGNAGGAIYAAGAGAYIGGNTTFINNVSGAGGGAIFAPAAGVAITLDATAGDILFRGNIANAGSDFSQPGTPNAITLTSGSSATPGGGQVNLNLDTGDGPAGNTIYFYDPISVTNFATFWDADQIYANTNITGNGTVLLDTNQSIVANGTTTLASGTMLLANGAIYGAGTDATVGEVVYLQAPAVLAATNGSIMAGAITYDPGAQINVSAGGTLGLYTTTFVGAGLRITGNGTIDAGGNTLNAAYVAPGSIVSGTPGAPVAPNTPQTLAIAPGTTLNIEDGGVLAFDLFTGNASDLLAADILTLTGSACITPIGDTAGHYELITATNDLSALDFFTQVGGATISFEAGGTQLWLDLTVNNSAIRWTGLGDGIWASALSSNFNWDDGAGGHSFINGDSVSLDDTATGTRAITIDPAGVAPADMTVNNSAGNDYTIAGAGGITTAATGALVKTGAGALNFANTAANTFTAGIELSGGAIGFTNPAQLGDGGNGIHVTADAALRANAPAVTLANDLHVDPAATLTLDTGAGAANTLTYTGTLYLYTTATLAKTGPGTLSIASNNAANTGNTLVTQGILSLDGANAGALGGAIDIAANATLAGSGSATGTVNAANGAIIYPGATTSATAPVTLNINNLNLNSSTLNFNLFATGTNDRIAIAGTLNPGAGTNTINISTFQSGTYNLGNLAPLLGSSYTITIGGIAPATGARQVAGLVTGGVGGNDLLLETLADISRILYWTGSTSATWTPNDADWTDHAAVTLFAGGDRVIFDGAADAANPANRAIAIAGSIVNVSDMLVQGAANYTFTGAGITADPASVVSGTVITATGATGKLTKTSNGTLAFQNAANNFTGGIELDGGALTFTTPAQLGDGGNGITIGGDATLANASGADQTLANHITVAANVTGTLDTAANTLTLTGILAASGGTASLSSAPAGALAAASAAAPSTLAKIGAGALTLATDITDANLAVAIDEGSLLLNAGTVSVANLQFAASTTLAGAGALAGAATLNGQVTADIASGNTVALTGTLAGAGGFLKTNTGELQLTGPAALGYTGATQIDQGTLRLTGFTGTTGDAATITQAITLNGGTLALGAGAAAPSEPTANDWTGLNIIPGAAAATSAITGVNDIIHVGSGTFAPALQSGLIVAIDAGAGNTAALGNTANNFTGPVRIDSGTLQVTTTTGLGAFSANNVKAVLNGGALQISATLPINARIEARADGIITVDDGIYSQWQQITNPTSATAAITKAGSGTLCINANFQATSLTIAEGRYISNASGNVGLPTNSGAITILDGAVFQTNGTGATLTTSTLGLYGAGQTYIATTNGTISNPVTGAGTLEVTAGQLVLTSPNTDIANIAITGAATAVAINGGNLPSMNFGARNGNITVDQATLVLASSAQNLGNLTLANGATLAFLMPTGTTGPLASAFKTATLASLATTGTGAPALWFNANLATGRADHLAIDTPVSGTYAIGVQPYGSSPSQYRGTMNLISAPAGSDAKFLPLTPVVESPDGLYSYTLDTLTGNGGGVTIALTGTGAMGRAPALINSLAATLPLSWFTELDSVNQRLGELHFENRDAKDGLSAWMRGYGAKLNFNNTLTGYAYNETHYAGEAGVDYKVGDTTNNIYLGAYAGYGAAQRDYSAAGDATSDSAFGGLYLTAATPGGWYLDLTGKFNNFKNRFDAASLTGQRATADYHNWAIGGSLELGKRCDIGNGLFVEPQIQGALTAISGATYTTNSGMTVMMLPATALRARAGLRFGYDIETTDHGTISIYLKGYYGNQWVYDGQVNITAPDGQSPRYSCVITGEYLEGGAGLAWNMAKTTQVYIDYTTTQARYYIQPWGFNVGVRHLW